MLKQAIKTSWQATREGKEKRSLVFKQTHTQRQHAFRNKLWESSYEMAGNLIQNDFDCKSYLYNVLGLWNKILTDWRSVSPVIRHTHLPLCCSNMLCSVLSQTLSHDASPQRRGHRQRSLCQERRESPCSSKVPCLIPGQRGHGPQSSHGDYVQTTCNTNPCNQHKSLLHMHRLLLSLCSLLSPL